MLCLVAQSCLTLCDPMDCSPPGSSVHGILQARTLEWVAPRGVRPRLEGKPRTLLSSRVATRVSWSPLSGLKGVQPPLPFGERTWDCSPGHAGKDGPHLAMTEGSCGFSRPATRETWVQSLGQEDPLEKEMATHSSSVAWRIPWTEEPGGLQSMVLQRVGHD